MFELLNDMLELIYVSDMKTYDLLFMNTAGLEKFKIDKVEGLKCYEALQGFTEPCSFCTNAKLKTEEVYSWEHTNPVTERHYLLKDRIVEWQGQEARIEIAFDATENENEKIALKNALDAQQMVMECVKKLYQTKNISEAIQQVLEAVGTFLSAERAYIFDICGDKMSNTYEWCAKGIEPQIKKLKNLPLAVIDGWMPEFLNHECKIIEDLEKLGLEETRIYDLLKMQNINSLVAAPLEKDGKLIGYFAVNNIPAEKIRNIMPLFHTLRFFLMVSMHRAEDEKLLAKLSYHDVLTGFYNRNRFIQDTGIMSDYDGAMGIAYLDINGLKDINDHKGHAYGDRILCICARNIESAFVYGDFYRIGGDEFVVICKDIEGKCFKDKICKLKKLFEDEKECHAAIGYQWLKRVDDVQALISKTDAMMYEDKRAYYKKNPPSKRYRQWE